MATRNSVPAMAVTALLRRTMDSISSVLQSWFMNPHETRRLISSKPDRSRLCSRVLYIRLAYGWSSIRGMTVSEYVVLSGVAVDPGIKSVKAGRNGRDCNDMSLTPRCFRGSRGVRPGYDIAT